MAILSEVGDQLVVKLGVLLAHLNEQQRRLLLEAEARLLGRGGVRLVARLTGVSEAKKREQLGRLPMGGREWHPKGEPVQVEDHSFFTRPDVGPPIQQDWAKYAPGEPLPKTCA
jgi:hypothetical protein